MTELIGEFLKVISSKPIVIPEDMVVTGATGALNKKYMLHNYYVQYIHFLLRSTNLDAKMRNKVEVKLSGMGDTLINSCTWRNITTLAHLQVLQKMNMCLLPCLSTIIDDSLPGLFCQQGTDECDASSAPPQM